MKSLLSLTLIAITSLFTSSASATIGAEVISKNVQQFLQTHHLPTLQTRYPDGEYNISVGKIDPRLSLTECSEPMQFKLHGARKDYGYLTVKVRCPSSQSWTIYVSANVDVKTRVVVAARPLQRGEIIARDMVERQFRSLTGLGQQFYQDISDVLGKQVKQSTSSQNIIRVNMLSEALAVKRGDKVTIVARSDSLAVKMNGTALSNGQKGEQIRVRNNRSKRVIRAEVLGNGEVAVLL